MSKRWHARVPVGDTEREQARALLGIHYAKGRLTAAEHEKRHALAGLACCRADVDELFADLPAQHPDRDEAPPPAPTRPRPAAERIESTTSSVPNLVLSLCGVAGLPAALVLTVYYGARHRPNECSLPAESRGSGRGRAGGAGPKAPCPCLA